MEYDELDVSISNYTKFKVVVLGDQSVGKTCILQRITSDTFDHQLNPTVGVDFLVKSLFRNDKTYKIHFWDTAGQERFKALIPSYVKDC